MPTDFASTSAAAWVTPALVGVGLTALLYGCAWLIRRRPALVNLPNRVQIAAREPAEQQMWRHFSYR